MIFPHEPEMNTGRVRGVDGLRFCGRGAVKWLPFRMSRKCESKRLLGWERARVEECRDLALLA